MALRHENLENKDIPIKNATKKALIFSAFFILQVQIFVMIQHRLPPYIK